MTDKYDFGNLSPIEFEALCADLLNAETKLRFERFSEGPDGGIDGRHSSASDNIILQAKHFKDSSWSDLKKAAKRESSNVDKLDPTQYYLLTSQRLTPPNKDELKKLLNHGSVDTSDIWGRTELNDSLRKHGKVEKRHIKLWLSSTAVLEKILNKDIAVFTEATRDEVERVLKVYVANPSLKKAADILNDRHCLIVSGPPGVGKTTLAQVLAAEYCDEGWELIAIGKMEDAFASFQSDDRQVFVFDDFLGKIKLDSRSLAEDENKIARFIEMVARRENKRFILTTRSYVLQAARNVSEALDDEHIDLTELVLDLKAYNREIKARILYNHLYHSNISEEAVDSLISGNAVQKIVDHRNYLPRIVQWMTDHLRNRDCAPDEYPDRFFEVLENPHKIWDKAFKQHISTNAQFLLYCMYFSEVETFPLSGIKPAKLKQFFDKVLVKINAGSLFNLRDSIFEETLREIKSSFIVVDKNRINFINPSVLDFLSQEVKDTKVIELLVSSAPSYRLAVRLWRTVKEQFEGNQLFISKIAYSMQCVIQSNEIEGRLPLEDMVSFISELLMASYSSDFLNFIRSYGLLDAYWVNESKFPSIIDDLEEGRFCDLPHAAAYARLFRCRLYGYVVNREYSFELDELAELIEGVYESFIVFPANFHESLQEVITETIDALDPQNPFIQGPMDDILSDWLVDIEKIECYLSNPISLWKKEEIQEALREVEQRFNKEKNSLSSSISNENVSKRKKQYNIQKRFSNDDLDTMFSSLRKS